ncbi:hypothetical protein LguiB_033257 [Lonicera macranthoides]
MGAPSLVTCHTYSIPVQCTTWHASHRHAFVACIWSLIAGRLPGRTANDVKNYWNSHLQKKLVPPREDAKIPNPKKITEANIIKPRPRTFTKNPPCLEGKSVTRSINSIQFLELNNCKPLSTTPPPPPPPPPAAANDDNIVEWWANLFANNGEAGQLSFHVTEGKEDLDNMTGVWTTDEMMIPTHETGASIFVEDQEAQMGGSSSDFCVDIDICDLLSFDQQVFI